MLFPFGTKCHEDDCHIYLICCCSSARLCPTLCDPMNCSLPGFPDLHYLPEFVQTQVPWAGDAIQPSHPLSLSSPPALKSFPASGSFWWAISSHQVAKVLCFSFSINPSSEHSGLISFRNDRFDLLAIQGLWWVFSSITVWKHQFFCAQFSLWSKSHSVQDYWKTIALTIWTFVSKVVSLLFNTCLGLLQLFF